MTDNDPIEDEEANAELDRFQARDAAANGRDDDLILVLHHTFVKRSATTPKLRRWLLSIPTPARISPLRFFMTYIVKPWIC